MVPRYMVKRSTAPDSGYAQLAGNFTATSYTDTAVKNGTTYYYAVTAVNAPGREPTRGSQRHAGLHRQRRL